MGMDEQVSISDEDIDRQGEEERQEGIDRLYDPDGARGAEQLHDNRYARCGVDFCPHPGVHIGHGPPERARSFCDEEHRPTWLDLPNPHGPSQCFYCGRAFGRKRRRTRDHVIPVARGGSRMSHNVVYACFACNQLKGILTGLEFISLRDEGVAVVRVAETRMQNLCREVGPATVPVGDLYVQVRTVLAQHYVPLDGADTLARDLIRIFLVKS